VGRTAHARVQPFLCAAEMRPHSGVFSAQGRHETAPISGKFGVEQLTAGLPLHNKFHLDRSMATVWNPKPRSL